MRASLVGLAAAAWVASACDGSSPHAAGDGALPPQTEPPPVSPPGSPPPVPPPPAPSPGPAASGPFAVALAAEGWRFLGVGADGTAYGLSPELGAHRVLASADGRTWELRGEHPARSSFLVLAPLSSGTLLADVSSAGGHAIARSADGGRSWTDVLALGSYRLLTPRNVAELGGEVFLLEYQSFTGDDVPIRLLASRDDGRTWSERHVFTDHRHGHGLRADPARGALWIFMGDRTGGTLLSRDGGATATLVRGPLENGVFVDAAVVPGGILAGNDSLYAPLYPMVVSLGLDASFEVRAALPGPSYSFFPLSGGGYLVGTAREAGGDVYAQEDVSAHLLHSEDGLTFREVFSCERLDPGTAARSDVYGELASGEPVVEVRNCVGYGPNGMGYVILRRVP
jgi:hypothetical protein